MIERGIRRALVFAFFSLHAGAGIGQDAPAPAAVPRSPEGSRIINFPSADVPAPGTLGMLFSHRFAQPLEDSDWHSLASFDSGADIGIGASYVPLRNLEVAVDRSSNQDDWEIALKYRFFERSASFPLSVALRAGVDIRPEAMGVGWDDVATAMRRLAWYVRHADLPYTIADARPVSDDVVGHIRDRIQATFGAWQK